MERPIKINKTLETNKKSPNNKLSLGHLHNKTYFLNLSRPRNITELQKGIKALGGKLEEFFTQEIDCVLTDEKIDRTKGDETTGTKEVETAPVVVASAIGSRRFRKLPQVKKNNVLEKAREWKIKVQNVDHFIYWMKNVLQSKGSTSRYINTKSKASLESVIPLKNCFLKVESIKKCHKPLVKTFNRFPALKYKSGDLKSPFEDSSELAPKEADDINEDKTDNSPSALPKPQPVQAGIKNPAVEQPVQAGNKTPAVATPKPAITTVKKKVEKRQFCECCSTYYTSLNNHVKGPRHKGYQETDTNFACVLEVLNDIQKMHDRLEKVAENKRRSALAAALNKSSSVEQQPNRKINLTLSGFCDENVPPPKSFAATGPQQNIENKPIKTENIQFEKPNVNDVIINDHTNNAVAFTDIKQIQPIADSPDVLPLFNLNSQTRTTPSLICSIEIPPKKRLLTPPVSSTPIDNQKIEIPLAQEDLSLHESPELDIKLCPLPSTKVPSPIINPKMTAQNFAVTAPIANNPFENLQIPSSNQKFVDFSPDFSTLFPNVDIEPKCSSPEILNRPPSNNSTSDFQPRVNSSSLEYKKDFAFSFPSLTPNSAELHLSEPKKLIPGNISPNVPNMQIQELHQPTYFRGKKTLTNSSSKSTTMDSVLENSNSLSKHTLFSSENSEDEDNNENISGVVQNIINSERCKLENGEFTNSANPYSEVSQFTTAGFPTSLSIQDIKQEEEDDEEMATTEPYNYEDTCSLPFEHNTNSLPQEAHTCRPPFQNDKASRPSDSLHDLDGNVSLDNNISNCNAGPCAVLSDQLTPIDYTTHQRNWTVKQHGITKLVFSRTSSAGTEKLNSDSL